MKKLSILTALALLCAVVSCNVKEEEEVLPFQPQATEPARTFPVPGSTATTGLRLSIASRASRTASASVPTMSASTAATPATTGDPSAPS